MVYNLMSTTVKWHKNGIYWWSRMFCKLIGEDNYDKIKLEQ